MRGTRPTETAIHRAVVQLLTLTCAPDVVWMHIPNGEARNRAVAGKLKGLGVQAGVPDLLLLRGGRARFVELKRPGGRLSPVQREMRAALVGAGASVEVVTSVDEMAAWLKREGLTR